MESMEDRSRSRRCAAVLAVLIAVWLSVLLLPALRTCALWIGLLKPMSDTAIAKTGLYTETEMYVIPYETVYENDYSLEKGKTVVASAGCDGVRTAEYEVEYYDGVVLGIREIGAAVDPATPEVIRVGQRVKQPTIRYTGISEVHTNDDGSGYLLLSSGEAIHFTGSMTVTCTAYTAGVGGVGTRTASGQAVRRGVAAVDRSVIPLGTKMFIAANGYTYGVATASDTGVRGKTVDLYMETLAECRKFGRRNATVYFID